MTDTPITTTLSARVLNYVRQHPGCTAREVVAALGDPRASRRLAAMRHYGTVAVVGARGSRRYSVAREPRVYRRGSGKRHGSAGSGGAMEALRAELAAVEALLANHDALLKRRDALRAAIELLGGGAA